MGAGKEEVKAGESEREKRINDLMGLDKEKRRKCTEEKETTDTRIHLPVPGILISKQRRGPQESPVGCCRCRDAQLSRAASFDASP